MQKILFVALGGMIGAIARYLVTILFINKYPSIFPYATLTVNVIGCFVIGVFFSLMLITEHTRLFVVVGFLGSLTTFSTFSIDTLILLQNGQLFIALANVMSNIVLGFLATYLGMNIIKLF